MEILADTVVGVGLAWLSFIAWTLWLCIKGSLAIITIGLVALVLSWATGKEI